MDFEEETGEGSLLGQRDYPLDADTCFCDPGGQKDAGRRGETQLPRDGRLFFPWKNRLRISSSERSGPDDFFVDPSGEE